MTKPQNTFNLHLISDATGETLLAAGRAAASQYRDARAVEHVHPLVRNARQIAKVFEAVAAEPGIILYTMMDETLSRQIEEAAKTLGLPCVPLLEPVLAVFGSYLGAPAGRRVGAQHALDADYFRRIAALDFTMDHDDGQMPDDADAADIVLVGVSRTSKTPTSIYLANRGLKTMNIPIVLGHPVPESLVNATRPLVVGLLATAERISQVRQSRMIMSEGEYDTDFYVSRAAIAEELAYARNICARHRWPTIDVTRRSIEETAAAILALRSVPR